MSPTDGDDRAETEANWRTHAGFLDGEAGEAFAGAVAAGRERLDEDLADRQQDVRTALDAENYREQ